MVSFTDAGKLPGYETGRSVTPREIHHQEDFKLKPQGIALSGDAAIDGSNTGYTNEIRVGWVLGRISTGDYAGMYVPCKRTRARVNASGSSGTSSAAGDFSIVVVDNAAAFKVGDVITVGGDTDLTILNVNYVTNEIKVDEPITVTADEVVIAQDGSQTPVGILHNFRKLRNDENDAAANKSADMEIEGDYIKSMLLGDVDSMIAASVWPDDLRVWNETTQVYDA